MDTEAAMLAMHGDDIKPSAASRLAPETLAQVFMHVDPHTLYTSVRSLSRSWKQCVEERILANEFHSGQWRVGLRVVRKPKTGKTWQGGVAGREGTEAPGARWHQCVAQIQSNQDATEEQKTEALARARRQYVDHIVSRPGSLEDDLAPLDQANASESSAPLVHVIPLHFQKYDGDSTTLCFATESNDWHALFEHSHGDGSVDASTGRLDLDFGIVWRFPGDGQGEDDWGVPDQENGWLSRFYCSSFDVTEGSEGAAKDNQTHTLHSTPLARRIRRVIQQRTEANAISNSQEDGNRAQSSTAWADDGHEYSSLRLSLGTEFFVRRSARANLLLRRLEAEAQAGEERARLADETYRARSQNKERHVSSASATPSYLSAAVKNKTQSQYLTATMQTNTSSRTTSGTSTPLPAWSTPHGRSFAEVVASPPNGRSRDSRSPSAASTGASTPAARAPSRSMDKPLFAQALQRRLTGLQAPSSSVATSGYTSVQHRTPIDARMAEEEDKISEKQSKDASHECDNVSDDGSRPATPATDTCSSPAQSRQSRAPFKASGIAGQISIPRAHFSAILMRPSSSSVTGDSASARDWTGGDEWGRGAHAQLKPLSHCPHTTAVWEWTR